MNDELRRYLDELVDAIGRGTKRKPSSIDAAIEAGVQAALRALAHGDESANEIARKINRRRSWATKAVTTLRRAQANVAPPSLVASPGTRVPSRSSGIDVSCADPDVDDPA